MFDNETNDYALSDCAWWDVSVTVRPWWASKDCSGRVGDTEQGVICEEHYNAIPGTCGGCEMCDGEGGCTDKTLDFEWQMERFGDR